VELLEASQPWERVNWAHNRCNEGPTVFRHGKKYYMTYSANDTSSPNYGIGYAIASNPLGPWKKGSANPVLATNKAVGASGPGHNSLVLSPDGKEMFIVYHTHADANHPSMDRVVNIDRVHISSSGILTVDGPTRSPQPMPSGTTSGMNN
jgi:GH43 family beta-xylosidase